MNMAKNQIPKINFSNTNTQVSRIGLGCMNIGLGGYSDINMTEEQKLNFIGSALEQGQNFFDTAFMYGDSEQILGKAIKKFGRDKFFLSTKVPYGEFSIDQNTKEVNFNLIPGTEENIIKYCNLSIERLGIDQIDLLYHHRVDPNIPIEQQVLAFKTLIEQGKIKHYGLSEVSEDTIRRAHKVYPVTAVQEEYSIFVRDIEKNGVLSACKELGIALVSYAPLVRGMLTGTLGKNDVQDAFRSQIPFFLENNFEQNMKNTQKLQQIANNLNITTGQLSLAWLLAQGNNIFPIPGTKTEKHLIENQNAGGIELQQEIVQQINEMIPQSQIHGERVVEKYRSQCHMSTIQQ